MNRHALRYSIAFVLFVCLCVAGALAGYREGFSEGYASGTAKRQSEEPFVKVYEVGDLIRSASAHADSKSIGQQLDFSPLMEAVQTIVDPDEWEVLGGPCAMAPLPWLESLAVNATSGVHERLDSFFGDLSSVKVAVAEARRENEAMQRARETMVERMLEPAASHLGEPLKPIAADIDLVGSWDVQRHSVEGVARPLRYTFVDSDTVTLASAENGQQPNETWYFLSPGSMVISGTGYIAASTADQVLVLIPYDDAENFLVARQVAGEPSEAPEISD